MTSTSFASVAISSSKSDAIDGHIGTNYIKLVPDQIRQWLPGQLVTFGTDGFGRSDTREALRRHFEIDAEHIVYATLLEWTERTSDDETSCIA